ncbi:GvpL/GvpF family gas vesicle protein [Streptomyces sp. NPDC059491]|uniref:GvpL/GvpF family gas vesicle protein n=1 Tax=Streptomyces sp. NPDC059491 TaxID=3346850 RepID=UPI0036B5B947
MNGPAATATLTYVYAVAPPAPALDDLLPGLTGVAGTPVALLTPEPADAGPVAFVISDVPRAEFAEDVLAGRFEDLGWLEETARAHHHVIEALAAHTTVLPLRMATLYEDHARAVRALHEQSQPFTTQLAQLAAHTEYGVKLYVRHAAAPPETTAPDRTASPTPDDSAPAGPESASPGKAYLRARRAQRDAHEDRYQQAGIAADRVAEIGRLHSARHVAHPPQSGPLAAASMGENVLNAAFLVPDAEAQSFTAAIGAAAGDLPGVVLELTGPWAPYSFTALPRSPDPPSSATSTSQADTRS